MSQRRTTRDGFAVLTMALFSIVSFAQGVKLADGVEPLPADAETRAQNIRLSSMMSLMSQMAPYLIQRCGDTVRAVPK